MQGASELHCAEKYNPAVQHAIFSTLVPTDTRVLVTACTVKNQLITEHSRDLLTPTFESRAMILRPALQT